MRFTHVAGRALVAAVIVAATVSCDVNNPKPTERLKATAASSKPFVSDIAYGSLASQTLDMYAPTKRKHGGVIVWLHGGGWSGGTIDEISPIALWLVRERGWTLLSVNYRTTDQAPFPAALEDAKLAIRWAKANAAQHGLDPNQVFAMGWSAGGHLAALTATTAGQFEPDGIPKSLSDVDSRPAGGISMSAPLDPATFAITGTWNLAGNRRDTSRLLGCTDDVTIDECPVPVTDVAVSTWADSGDAPIYITAGDLDPIVELQSQALDPAGELVTALGQNKVWLDVVDSGPIEFRAHSVDFGMNRWALEQFLKWGPTL